MLADSLRALNINTIYKFIYITLSHNLKLSLYKIVISNLEFTIEAWKPYCKKAIHMLEIFHN